jgi:hypothetical protein
MNIEEIESSTTLKSGQLITVWKAWRWFAFYAGPETSTPEFQLYRHRRDPVPGVHRSKHGRFFRHPKTTNERRATVATRTFKDFLEAHGAVFKLRRKRTSNALPSLYDDIYIRHQRSWKKHRLTQRKCSDEINRQIHSPPFWVRYQRGFQERAAKCIRCEKQSTSTRPKAKTCTMKSTRT